MIKAEKQKSKCTTKNNINKNKATRYRTSCIQNPREEQYASFIDKWHYKLKSLKRKAYICVSFGPGEIGQSHLIESQREGG